MTGDMLSLITGLVGVVLTLIVFSRLLGDNPAFRTVQYLFVGASLGYAFVVVYHQVLRPNAVAMILGLNDLPTLGGLILPFLLGILLLARMVARQQISWVANIPLALVFGVGAALALGGALVGTLAPQIQDTARPISNDPFHAIGAVLLVLGVVLSLSYFYFTVPRETPRGAIVQTSARIGRWFLLIAFGFFLAGSLLTYITALNERLAFIVGWVRGLFG
ncbi:hypothetical protein OSCT_2792 [Oscillochloris trichoides DG-6]|uniref:Uncharacterized protein n=1 Tax=Oscillochloris trichoides DG-6 TaxID=765420 RepID=E1IHJ1_9CHLR|nr:hypothetical protein [Oscillochloris trichoides]EFO79354.1 hypothetical protein OSCT_2792 [Oscillochloris trichoides DG-6]